MNDIHQHNQLKERQGASPALTSSVPAKDFVSSRSEETKLSVACRGEKTGSEQPGRVSAHSVHVLSVNGHPLTPTTPAKARKLLKGGQAKKHWSKFGTFGIQMLRGTRKETPQTTLGHDPGEKYDGFSVVCGHENNLSIKWDLPDKKNIVRKMKKRKIIRRIRRNRLRLRPARWSNRSRKGFIAPSQFVIVLSRLKAIKELVLMFPVTKVGFEDVKFNHTKHKWGKRFSTVEIGKTFIKNWFEERSIEFVTFRGFETAEIRKELGFKKTSSKSADKFTAHCSDSLSLAIEAGGHENVVPGTFLAFDDTYRCVRRKIHDSNIKPGGLREKYSHGTVFGIQKGKMIGTRNGKIGRLCGQDRGRYLYQDFAGKRQATRSIRFVSRSFKRKERLSSPQGKPRGSRQS